jgi:hypothetical protein
MVGMEPLFMLRCDRIPAILTCSRQFDCGLSISTRWISSAIADFGFALLFCVLVCESAA